eukprot:NODE_514_length_771_cov_424.427019_g505_i0.p1 GENE.NODE_514_length_771_cov_424.427019_g505_i0~~NODE_514_length_771_cov_424.427019_g505_i0.p1  ORF type:complete len:156 (+),score=19.10 NODE_514_length_771_cov_424.427019_g505_i0:100-567(+)
MEGVPADCIGEIGSFLSSSEVGACTLVSKHFNGLFSSVLYQPCRVLNSWDMRTCDVVQNNILNREFSWHGGGHHHHTNAMTFKPNGEIEWKDGAPNGKFRMVSPMIASCYFHRNNWRTRTPVFYHHTITWQTGCKQAIAIRQEDGEVSQLVLNKK